MTSFSLLKFKFTQIFLMGQNSFSKTTNFLKNRPIIRSNRPNFTFQNFSYSSRGLTSFRPNFSDFRWFFLNFENATDLLVFELFPSAEFWNTGYDYGPWVHLGWYSTRDTVHECCCIAWTVLHGCRSRLRVIGLWALSLLAGVIRVRVSHLYI
jgi:hypothetical protein